MPTSDVGKVPAVIWRLMKLKPKTVLDIGVGFGKYGMLTREYLGAWFWRYFPADQTHYQKDGQRIEIPEKNRWDVRLVGVEVCEWYRQPHHDFLYDEIHWGTDARYTQEYLVEPFDVIFLLDVIEHMPKEAGRILLNTLFKHAKIGVFVSHPFPNESALAQKAYFQGELRNEDETHHAVWSNEDFSAFPHVMHLKNNQVHFLAKEERFTT